SSTRTSSSSSLAVGSRRSSTRSTSQSMQRRTVAKYCVEQVGHVRVAMGKACQTRLSDAGYQSRPQGGWLDGVCAEPAAHRLGVSEYRGFMPEEQVPTRNLAMELVRVTEAAALAAAGWMGRGDKNAADGAAVDAMRVVLDTVPMDGVVIIGEGEKDEAPMLYNGERIGDGSPPAAGRAVEPTDGAALTALGRPTAFSVIVVGEKASMYDPGPCVYMEKIAVGPGAADAIDVRESAAWNIRAVSEALDKPIREMSVVVL